MAPRSPWVKIDRALDHIKTLDDAIKGWLATDAYTIERHHDPDARRTAYRVRLSEPFPIDWSAFIGDAVHNLRSALDHFAFALNSKGYADASGGAELPAPAARASEFPIFGDEDSAGNSGKGPAMFAKAKNKIADVPAGARTVIENEQPYKAGAAFRERPLWLIYDLDRIDKHREILPAAAARPDTEIDHLYAEGLDELAIGGGGTVKDGDELLYWVTAEGAAEPTTDIRFAREIAFGNRNAMAWAGGSPRPAFPAGLRAPQHRNRARPVLLGP